MLDQLAATKVPTLVGLFAATKLTENLTAAELVRAVPGLCDQTAIVPAWCELRTTGGVFRAERIPMAGEPAQWPIGRLRITLAAPDVRARLQAAWGAPTTSQGVDYWFAPSSHLRVALHQADMEGDPKGWVDLDFSGYWTADEFLGTGKGLFGFERGAQLLRANAAELPARYGPRIDGTRIVLWPIDVVPRPTVISLGGELAEGDGAPDATIGGYSIDLHGVDRDSVVRAMNRRFGKGHEDEDDETTVYKAKPRISLDSRELLEVGVVDE